MSMTGSGRAVICRNLGVPLPTVSPRSPNDPRQPAIPCLPQLPRSAGVGGALQAGFAGPQRRTSFVGILHEMSAQNRLLSCQQNAPGGGRRLSFSGGDIQQRAPDDEEPSTTADDDEEKRDSGDGTASDRRLRFSVGCHDNGTPTGDFIPSSRDQRKWRSNVILLPNLWPFCGS